MHMQKMGTGDGAERKSFSGPFNRRGSRKSTRFDNTASSSSARGSMRSSDKDDYVITLGVGGGDVEDPESTLLDKEVEKRPSFRKLVVRSASAGIQQVSEELKKMTSFSQPPIVVQSDGTKSAAINALTGLKFISNKTVGTNADGTKKDPWEAVEERFKILTGKTTGLLPRALFGECIGTLLVCLLCLINQIISFMRCSGLSL